MKFEPTTCSDCSYPPNFIVTETAKKVKYQCFTIKCRDCGDIWEESPDYVQDDADLDDDE
jgi:uncharacterized Zn finger protein